jgi:tetratricopeptide (TPR) repeat protein
MGMGFGMSRDSQEKTRKPWTELFFKPNTRDERVKDYVPEVLEESLAEQRAVLAQQTTRDLIVEHWHKVLRELENKAPTPSIYPALNQILALYGPDHLISQRGLNLLLYPGTATCFQQTQPPELISAFQENFKQFVDSVEQSGSYIHDVKRPAVAAASAAGIDAASATDAEGAEAAATAATATEPAAEPVDVTYLVKCMAGMSLANMQVGDNAGALKCCDAALEHVIDESRKGGIHALKAGVQIKLKDYAGAHESALKAIATSQSPQGYLQGAAALRLMKKNDEALALLTEGVEACPGEESIAKYLEGVVAAKEKEAARLTASTEAGGTQIDDGKRKPRRRHLQLAQ